MEEWREALPSLRAEYVREARQRLDGMRRSLEALAAGPGDRDALHDLMRGFHGFTGSGTTYGFPGITALGREGEASCSALLKGAAASSSSHLDRWRQLRALLESELGAAGGPRTPAGAAGSPPAPASRGDVLVVDDDEALARLLSHLLEQEGLSVRRAATKAEALRAVGERVPDGCIVDIRLPDGSGYDLVKHLRAQPGGDGAVLILSMLTGFLDKVEAIHCGADGYFEKPVDWEALMRRLLHLLERKGPEKRRVLSVEDDPAQAAFLRTVLESAGYEVRVCDDPKRFEAELIAFRPDLVMVDILLPGVSGHDLVRYLRQDERHATLPVLFLSTEGQLEAQIQSARVGGDDHLVKPVSPELLLTTVAARIERGRFLQTLMDRDGLTRLLTHSAFLERARAAVARKRRDPRRSLAWVMVDLDHFKSINDGKGHPAGDRVLAALSALLRRRLRQTDTIGRYGGEEFAILLEDLDEEDTMRLVDRLREEFTGYEHRGPDRAPFRATFSAGVAMLEPDADLERWRKAADEALYAAKAAGRDQVASASRRARVAGRRGFWPPPPDTGPFMRPS